MVSMDTRGCGTQGNHTHEHQVRVYVYMYVGTLVFLRGYRERERRTDINRRYHGSEGESEGREKAVREGREGRIREASEGRRLEGRFLEVKGRYTREREEIEEEGEEEEEENQSGLTRIYETSLPMQMC